MGNATFLKSISKLINGLNEFNPVRIHFLALLLIAFLSLSSLHSQPILYGLTTEGGEGYGVIFRHDFQQKSLTGLFSFLNDSGNSTGMHPHGSLVADAKGKMYGMTHAGGLEGGGVIFSFEPASGKLQKLFDLNYTTGIHPYGSLILGPEGVLFGLTSTGGDYWGGTIFSFIPETKQLTVLHSFTSLTGHSSFSTLVLANDALLYGVTLFGGAADGGTIFSFDPVSKKYNNEYDFKDPFTTPHGKLIQGSNGLLYGMTTAGGTTGGLIYSFNISTKEFKIQHELKHIDGVSPYGSLIESTDGKLYGLTSRGGLSDAGTIFTFDPKQSTFSKIHDFDKSNGNAPHGSLLQASDKKLYGMTKLGGVNNSGVLFSIDFETNKFLKLEDFSGQNGAFPDLGSLIENRSCIPGLEICDGKDNDCDGEIDEGIITKFYLDKDNDGFGNPTQFIEACGPPSGYVANSGDCNDNNQTINPNSPEICSNKIDDNCNGQVDEKCWEGSNPRISMANVSVVEGNAVNTRMNFILYLDKASSAEVKVKFQTEDGTAVSSLDFIGKSEVVIFPPYTLYKQVTVMITADRIHESTEGFKVRLSQSENGYLGNTECIGLIINDDHEPIVRMANMTVHEKDRLAKVQITLSNPSSKLIKIKFDTKDITANSPADYNSIRNGEITFLPGETNKTIDIRITADIIYEPTERFSIIQRSSLYVNQNVLQGAKPAAIISIVNTKPEQLREVNIESQSSAVEENVIDARVIPNPSNSQFYLNNFKPNKKPSSILVRDVTGKLIMKTELNLNFNNYSFGNSWKAGTYFLEVKNGEYRRVFKLVKL